MSGGGGGDGARKSEAGFFGTNEEGARHGLPSLPRAQFEVPKERNRCHN